MNQVRKALAGIVFCSVITYAFAGVAASPPAGTTVVVKPSTMNGWYFWNDKNDTLGGSPGELISGPIPAPLGTGSVRLGRLTDAGATAAGHSVIATNIYAGTPLASITNLTYSTYQPGPTLAIALQFDVRYRTNDTSYGGRLVFEPYQNGHVAVGSGWQLWTPLSGLWWASKTTAAGSNGMCLQSTPCTWPQINAAFPAAQIYDRFLLKAGSGTGWVGFDGNADALTVGVSGTDTTYDFEAEKGCTIDCYVDAASGNDSYGGDTPGSAKKTIQAAVGQVASGGTVHVAAGSYVGPLNIGRPMILSGAEAGNNPVLGQRGPESTLAGLTTIQAANVTIDGFSLTNPAVSGSVQAILIRTVGSGAVIQNNIISGVGDPANAGNVHTIYLDKGPDDVEIVNNVIANIASKLGSASAVFIGDSRATDPSERILIRGNAISNVKNGTGGAYGISINNGAYVSGSTRGYTTVSILDNTIDDLAGGVLQGSAGGWAHAIGLEGDTPGVVVAGNSISNVVDMTPSPFNDAIAVWFETNFKFSTGHISHNNFDGVEWGIAVHPALSGSPVSGTCNWWGRVRGPNSGSASKVTSNVTYTPWLTSSGGVCDGDTTTPPVVTVPDDVTIEATSASGAAVLFSTSALDIIDGSLPVVCRMPSLDTVASGATFPLGSTAVTCSATDSDDNTGSGSFTVTVADTTAPAVTAQLVPLSKGGDDDSEQTFRVVFLSTDLVGVVSTTASLNGVAVSNGQFVKLKVAKKGKQKAKNDDKILRIEATSFTLTVTAADAAHNATTVTAVPVFNKNGKDDDGHEKDGKKDEKKEKDDKRG